MNRNLKTLHLKQAAIRDRQRERFDRIHELIHEIMRDFDRAVLIHEVLAELEGRNPAEVTKALLPVRTVKSGIIARHRGLT